MTRCSLCDARRAPALPTVRRPLAGRLVVALTALAAAGLAQADLVSGSLSFSASGFPAGAPLDAVFGTVTYSFDNSANFFGAADGSIQNGVPVHVSFSGLSLPGSWTPVLTFVRSGVLGGVPVADLMSIGHALNGTNVLAGTDDWRVAFNTISVAPSFREFTYATADTAALFQTFSGTAVPVPEPATALLWLLGLAGLSAGAARRGQRSEGV